MKSLWLKHIRDIAILPFSVTCIIPALIYDPGDQAMPQHVLFRLSGAGLIVAGASVFVYTVFLFNRFGKGTLAPWSPKAKLIISGPYRYCRNPMISGVGLVLIGESFIFHSATILIWTFAFFTINTLYFLFIEEPDLSRKFGEAYISYRKNVPRWLPRRTPFNGKLDA